MSRPTEPAARGGVSESSRCDISESLPAWLCPAGGSIVLTTDQAGKGLSTALRSRSSSPATIHLASFTENNVLIIDPRTAGQATRETRRFVACVGEKAPRSVALPSRLGRRAARSPGRR